MDILWHDLSMLRRRKLAVAECNDASWTSQLSENDFHKGYLCRTASHSPQNDLNCVMCAFELCHVCLID